MYIVYIIINGQARMRQIYTISYNIIKTKKAAGVLNLPILNVFKTVKRTYTGYTFAATAESRTGSLDLHLYIVIFIYYN